MGELIVYLAKFIVTAIVYALMYNYFGFEITVLLGIVTLVASIKN